ncbi:MAG: IS110 family transposase [Deltaproteobacteria bacterium]|nr:IS110 family transposase [Deltaproteobacteria bacterium]
MNETELTRLEAFRQLKNEIRGSKQYLIVGIDAAKERHHAFFGTSTGKTLFKRLVFENNKEGFERLLVHTEALKARHGLEKVVFGMEPTANYHKPLGEYLIRRGKQAVLVSGVAVARNRELLDGRWDKHDVKDSANVADLISQGKVLYYDLPRQAVRDLRDLLSLKRRMKKQEHGLRVRIRNHLLAQYFPELDRYYGEGEAEGLKIVKWCVAPSVIAQLSYERFLRLVNPGPRITAGQRNRLMAVWKTAPHSIGCEAGDALGFVARMMVEGLEDLKEAMEKVDKRILEICKGVPCYPYLLTIPGVGPAIAAVLISAIGNPHRFATAKEVLKLAGLDLSAERSGKTSQDAVPVISKKGNAYLRYALYQAALIASSKNSLIMRYYTIILQGRERERGIRTKMRIKLAAKLLIIAWTLMRKQERFNPEYLRRG